MPNRSQSDMPGDDFLKPTPENYYLENPTVSWLFKRNPRRATQLERNAPCRFIGGIGPYYAHKYRNWLMGCSAFISFSCLVLLIIPLLSATSVADTLVPFSWTKGEAHWKLMIPIDWTDHFHVGLFGMTNVTKRGDTYFVKFNSPECTEVFHEACTSCESAGISTLVFVCISIAVVIPAFFLDIHRIFQYFDVNLSKIIALFLHIVLGVVFTVLAYMTFLQQCFMVLPAEAVHGGDGRKGVGMYLTWESGPVATIMLIICIIRPIPGLLHLLVPTPSWANNKGLKAAMVKQSQQKNQALDPWDTMAGGIARGYSDVQKDPAFSIPVQAALPPTVRYARKESAVSQASMVSGRPGEMVSAAGALADLPTLRAAQAFPEEMEMEMDDAYEGRDARQDRLRSDATGCDNVSLPGTGPRGSFVDPFSGAQSGQEGGVDSRQASQDLPEDPAPAAVPAEASIETRPMPKPSRKNGTRRLSATKKM